MSFKRRFRGKKRFHKSRSGYGKHRSIKPLRRIIVGRGGTRM